MTDFTHCPGCGLIRPDGEGFCPSCLGVAEPESILANPDPEHEESMGFMACLDALDVDPEPVKYRPVVPFAPDPSRGEAPAQSCLEMPDAGPLFAGCLEAKS